MNKCVKMEQLKSLASENVDMPTNLDTWSYPMAVQNKGWKEKNTF